MKLRGTTYRRLYEREMESLLARSGEAARVREEDLARLPAVVKAYVIRSGAIGRPRPTHFRAHWTGRMKRGKGGSRMRVRVDQFNSFEDPTTRLFLMHASLAGIPFEAFHRYSGATATMRVRFASLFDIVDASGPEMDQSETVTVFNDLCVLAPGALPFAPVTWTEIDARTVRAAYSNLGQTISADLSFDESGDLVGFVSTDRYQSADGKTFTKFPWSTPLRDHRNFGGVRLPAHGDAVWKEPDGDFVYAEFDLETIDYGAPEIAVRRREVA